VCWVTDKPDAPSAPHVHDISSRGCTVTYKSPLIEGGTAVSGYFLQFRTSANRSWTSISRRRITGFSVKIRRLHPDIHYQFRMAALNSCGVGKFSPATSTITVDSQRSCSVVDSDAVPVDVEYSVPSSISQVSNDFTYIIF